MTDLIAAVALHVQDCKVDNQQSYGYLRRVGRNQRAVCYLTLPLHFVDGHVP
jgi:hypothetical protein